MNSHIESKKDLWKYLWRDDRKYIHRLGIAILPCFFVNFMYFIWEPINLYAANREFFEFSLSNMWLSFLLLGVVVFIVTSLISALFKAAYSTG